MGILIDLPPKSHLMKVVQGLTASGWKINQSPQNARLVRNGQLIILDSKRETVRLRLFVYKVTGSSRGKPDERRIEITSTYEKGLARSPKFQDIVLA